jgi:hypothetical protein
MGRVRHGCAIDASDDVGDADDDRRRVRTPPKRWGLPPPLGFGHRVNRATVHRPRQTILTVRRARFIGRGGRPRLFGVTPGAGQAGLAARRGGGIVGTGGDGAGDHKLLCSGRARLGLRLVSRLAWAPDRCHGDVNDLNGSTALKRCLPLDSRRRSRGLRERSRTPRLRRPRLGWVCPRNIGRAAGKFKRWKLSGDGRALI